VRAGACAVLTSVLAAAAHADEAASDLMAMPLDRLMSLRVSGASQFEQKVSDAPSAVMVLTAADIKNFHWRTLADALASLTGVYVAYDRNYDYLGARGFLRPGDYDSRFLLLVNGNRQNDSVYDEATIGTEFVLDLDTVERIEYVPGPGSAIYGPNAFLGVINVITKRGSALNGVEAAAEFGSFGEKKGRLSYGWHGAGGADLLLSASLYNDPGTDLFFQDFDTPQQNDGVAHHLDYDRAQNALLRGAYQDWTLTAAGSSRIKGIPTASFGQNFDDPRSRTIDAQGFTDLAYEHRLDADTELAGHAFWNRYDYHGDYPSGAPAVVQIDGSHSLWYGAGAHLTTTALPRNKIVLGADYVRDASRDQYNYNLAPYALNLMDQRSNQRGGIYLEDELGLAPGLLLNAGLRFDDDAVTGSHLDPRAALIWKAFEHTTLKAIYSTAYRAPNAYELFFQAPGPGGEEASPGLGAEHISTYELVAEQGLPIGGLLTSSLYHYDVHDLITLTTDPVNGLLVYRNVDQVDANGFELAYQQLWGNGAKLRTSYSWQLPIDQVTGAQLSGSPRHLAKLNLSMPMLNWLSSGTELQYVGTRQSQSAPAGAYWVCNFSLLARLPLLTDADASLTAYNMFDRHYGDPAGPAFVQDTIGQDGRTYYLKLRLGYR
jgi:iron complex outermembrane receptor protein